MKRIPFSRRAFAKGLALTPFGLASSSAVVAQSAASTAQETTPQLPKRVPKTAAEYNRHPPIHEAEPFAGGGVWEVPCGRDRWRW